MNSKLLMVQGTSSGAGKSIIVTALCRILANMGFNVAPFKSQNMSSFTFKINSTRRIMANAQAIQAVAGKTNPDPKMNPILLKPIGNNESEVYTNGKFFSVMTAQDYYSDFVLAKGFRIALNAFNELKKEYDIIVLEGAGSPAEINIQRYDIANMLFANKVNSPVILTSDIERGGCFASILGTIMLLKPAHQQLIKGIFINKFLGDNAILLPAIRKIELKTKKPILGIIPKVEHKIPNEDSLDGNKISRKELRIKHNEKSVRLDKKKDLVINKEYFDLQYLDAEIDKLVERIGSSINIDYIIKKIIK